MSSYISKGTFLTPEQTQLLKIKMLENKLTLRTLAPKLPIGVATLSNKINGKYPFTQIEIFQLCEYLSISECDIGKYFFSPMLRDAICKRKTG